ncbi:hypothetical protein Hanom_Chr07g00591231 [Helianthus anomalus]
MLIRRLFYRGHHKHTNQSLIAETHHKSYRKPNRLYRFTDFIDLGLQIRSLMTSYGENSYKLLQMMQIVADC